MAGECLTRGRQKLDEIENAPVGGDRARPALLVPGCGRAKRGHSPNGRRGSEPIGELPRPGYAVGRGERGRVGVGQARLRQEMGRSPNPTAAYLLAGRKEDDFRR